MRSSTRLAQEDKRGQLDSERQRSGRGGAVRCRVQGRGQRMRDGGKRGVDVFDVSGSGWKAKKPVEDGSDQGGSF